MGQGVLENFTVAHEDLPLSGSCGGLYLKAQFLGPRGRKIAELEYSEET